MAKNSHFPGLPNIKSDEVVLNSEQGWLYFSNPYQIFSTFDIDEVVPFLRKIEKFVEEHKLYAAGFISYEAAPAFDKTLTTHSSSDFFLLWFGLYPEPRLITLPEPVQPKPTLTWSPTIDRNAYHTAIQQIKNSIADGYTYQVNYTMRLQTVFNADTWNFFLHLAHHQNFHAAYIDTGRYVIASASPELFFRIDNDLITSRPMKGTTKRGRTTGEDQEQVHWLYNSEKNRAENVMIVDMIRNDLGRIAKVGSVRVPQLFNIEKYPTLWQMTSTVDAKTDASVTDIFKVLFPCASITGAPKVSTMKIITDLESTPRKIYTGSIGHITPHHSAAFNIAIRTALIDRESQTAEYGIGGGIVWDSATEDEYGEALLKAHVLTEETVSFSLVETILWTPDDGFFLLEKHVARLLDSAEYFNFSISSQKQQNYPAFSKKKHPGEIIKTYLNEISTQFTSSQRVRLLLDNHWGLSHETSSFQSSNQSPLLKVCLTKTPVNSNDVFLFHKTTNREVYNDAQKGCPGFDDVLLYNEHNELTEFTIGNLVVSMDGNFYTPPVSCGLLGGTFRAALLESGEVKERKIQVNELEKCGKVFLVNSVRKWLQVDIG